MNRYLFTLVLAFIVTNQTFAAKPEVEMASGAGLPSDGAEYVTNVQSAIHIALERNPEVLAAYARSDAARANVLQSWDLDNPTVQYDVMIEHVETRVGPQDQAVSVMQELPFPLKLPLRTLIAKDQSKQKQHEVLHVEQHVRTQVIDAFVNLIAVQQIKAVLDEEKASLEQISDSVRSQFAAGGTSASDAAKIEMELAKLSERILKLKDERIGVEERLRVLLDLPPQHAWPLLPVAPVPELSLDLETIKSLALEHRHSLIIKKLQLHENKARHSLAKMEYLPDVEVGFKYIGIGDGTSTRDNDGQDAWMIPIKFSVPLWEPQLRGGLREAREMKNAATQDVKQAENMAIADVVKMHTKYQTSKERMEVYKGGWIPQAQQAFSSSAAAYNSAMIPILDVLDNLRMLLEANIGYWRSYADTFTAYALLEQAVGVPFDEIDALKRGES